jgi:hypothetical protein
MPEVKVKKPTYGTPGLPLEILNPLSLGADGLILVFRRPVDCRFKQYNLSMGECQSHSIKSSRRRPAAMNEETAAPEPG